MRLIHDCSRPYGKGVNSYATTTPFSYQTVDDALRLLPQNGYLAKIDLRNAYRVVPVHPRCYQATGLQWLFKGNKKPTFLFDTRLPFGAAKSPEIFNRLSKAVTRMMKRRGYLVIAYMDDFLVIADNKIDCVNGFNVLLDLFENLVLKSTLTR